MRRCTRSYNPVVYNDSPTRMGERSAGSDPNMSGTASALVETPSGKNAWTENFPVGSWLLPAALRPHVALFYAYARAIDDIADNPNLSADEKIRRLDGFERAIRGELKSDPAYDTAHRLRRSLAETGVPCRHCCDLVAAFKQDAVKNRYRDWDDLMGYCRLSASPVGRYLLDLHGESAEGYRWSDALCNALQVINHLQDCQDDYRSLDRVYLPTEWLDTAKCEVADLDAAAASPGVRQVLDRALDGVDELLATARDLPRGLVNRNLAMESSVIVRIAERLSDLLRNRDPLAGRVALSRGGFVWCGIQGILRFPWRG